MCHVDLPFLVVLVANEKHHVVCCSCYCWYAYHGYTSCRCRIKGVPEWATSLTVMSEDNTFWFKKVNQTRKYCLKTYIHFLIVLNKNQAVWAGRSHNCAISYQMFILKLWTYWGKLCRNSVGDAQHSATGEQIHVLVTAIRHHATGWNWNLDSFWMLFYVVSISDEDIDGDEDQYLVVCIDQMQG